MVFICSTTGLSGIEVGIENSGEPTLVDFGEMYANFLYTGWYGASLEIPLVRGSAMLTHIFKNAQPWLRPYCLVAINGEDATFECPEEESGRYMYSNSYRVLVGSVHGSVMADRSCCSCVSLYEHDKLIVDVVRPEFLYAVGPSVLGSSRSL